MLVWNQYSDTIYRVSEKGEETFAVWGKWDKRLTPAKVEKDEYYQCMIIYTIFETVNYYMCIWRPYDIMKGRWNYCFYDKASGKCLTRKESPMTYGGFLLFFLIIIM